MSKDGLRLLGEDNLFLLGEDNMFWGLLFVILGKRNCFCVMRWR